MSRRLPHRPTKDELLKAATSAFERFRIRFKWAFLRQVRPFNVDDISAFFSWLIVGNVLWVILGTTTFFSLVLLTANTVFAQESLARMIGNYLTKETGITVVFENAIVPNWRDGVISFRNVFISRRPGHHNASVTKGSQATAAAAAAAAAAASSAASHDLDESVIKEEPVDDGNYTQFDLTVDSINVTLSFSKWMNGKGILGDVEVKGLRGLVDRTHVRWLPGVDPRSYKKIHHPGDFEIDHFVLEDSLVTVLQPNDFRPFQISIFSCDLPQLRRQWLFYDLICANHMSGSYDDSLFTIHPRQTLRSTGGAPLVDEKEDNDVRNAWKKTSRLRVDGVAIDHLNRGITEGPFSWIQDGEVDLIADVMIPSEVQDSNFSRVVQDIVSRWEETVTNRKRTREEDKLRRSQQLYDLNEDLGDSAANNELLWFSGFQGFGGTWTVRDAIERCKDRYQEFMRKGRIELEVPRLVVEDELHQQQAVLSFSGTSKREQEKYIVFDLRVQLHNTRAAVPLLAPELSYTSNALVRPVVMFMNNHNTYIPINGRVVKKLSEFDGSWTIFDSGLMDDISTEVYEAIAANVRDDEERARRMRRVGMWSLQLAFQVILMSIGNLSI
ncbi:mitochondrial distribution and morphology protein family 31/32 [Lipomyces oligophaga]|uniref:mitochondrial distribution and morphology protein family 31/32 n=1 Tax=Lipomyces oligophaga TaxID=45792 RepID=UPI0034CE41EA